MEEWRDIPGFEGSYQISSFGRVKRLEHWKNQRTNRTGSYNYHKLSEKILKANTSGPYCRVNLSRDRVSKMYLVHRLVAITFIANPKNLPEVNHKDCNGHNNRVENLEWCDRTYNINYGNRTILAAMACEKKVVCIETGTIYDSGTKAAKALGLQKSKICLACQGKRKTTGGYHWRYA